MHSVFVRNISFFVCAAAGHNSIELGKSACGNSASGVGGPCEDFRVLPLRISSASPGMDFECAAEVFLLSGSKERVGNYILHVWHSMPTLVWVVVVCLDKNNITAIGEVFA